MDKPEDRRAEIRARLADDGNHYRGEAAIDIAWLLEWAAGEEDRFWDRERDIRREESEL